MSHADEVITDVNTRRLSARAEGERFSLAWDYPGTTLLEVRVLRSEKRVAESADDGVAEDQQVVYQDVTGSFRDTGLRPDRAYYYTVFARETGGEWVRWNDYSLPCEAKLGLRRYMGILTKAWRTRSSPFVFMVLFTTALTVATLGGARAAFASGDAAQSGSAADRMLAVVEADPDVAAVLAGKDAHSDVVSWGGTDERPAGYTFVFRWQAAGAADVDAVWSLLRTGDATPRAPYQTTAYRLRLTDVTAVRVDVLAADSRILQIMPVDGATQYGVDEQTWPPISWLPWLSARPWLPAPLFVVLALLLMARSYARSRAWNRRTPSMTRHDRQFIGRLAVLIFLLLGVIWACYEGWHAAVWPSLGTASTGAGELTSLPLLIIPPALFLVGLVLELSAGFRRGAWGLVTVLAGAASIFYLATTLTDTTTNLNLTAYILLAVLTLVAIPRAFTTGKMGWSRSDGLRFG